MRAPIPVYEIEGDAHACGVAHGRLASERVARTIETYLPAFLKEAKLGLDAVRERAREYLEAIRTIDADITAEIHGIAEGARQRVEDIVAVNCRTELLYGSRRGSEPATECTTIAVLPQAAREGTLIVGKNWDWRAPCVDTVIALRIRQTGKPALVLVVEAGMVGRDGLNEHGIGVCGNLLTSNEDRGQVGVPIPILRRRVLHSTTFYEAIDTIARSPRGASGNYLLAHRDGVAIDLEVTPERVYTIYPERGLITHSNHFQSPIAQAQGVAKYYTGDSLYRDFRARQLLEPHLGAITLEHVKAALADHFGYPRAICRHPHDYPGFEPTITIASLLFDFRAETIWVAAGPPCESTYVPVALPARGHVRSEAASLRASKA